MYFFDRTRYELRWVLVTALSLLSTRTAAEDAPVAPAQQTGDTLCLWSSRSIQVPSSSRRGGGPRGNRKYGNRPTQSVFGGHSRRRSAGHGTWRCSQDGDWIVMAVGAEPRACTGLIGIVENVGDQGFVSRQVAAPGGNGRWLIVWGKTILGCRYGVIELLRSLQSQGDDCFTDFAYVRERERHFPLAAPTITTLANICSMHIASTCCTTFRLPMDTGRWHRLSRDDRGHAVPDYELWLSPTFLSAHLHGRPGKQVLRNMPVQSALSSKMRTRWGCRLK